MILYEVNLTVDESIRDKYAVWLATHIQEMLAQPGFLKADWFSRRPEEEGIKGKVLWTIQYQLTDRAALVHYLTHLAPAMRQAAVERFGERFEASRRVLEPVRS